MSGPKESLGSGGQNLAAKLPIAATRLPVDQIDVWIVSLLETDNSPETITAAIRCLSADEQTRCPGAGSPSIAIGDGLPSAAQRCETSWRATWAARQPGAFTLRGVRQASARRKARRSGIAIQRVGLGRRGCLRGHERPQRRNRHRAVAGSLRSRRRSLCLVRCRADRVRADFGRRTADGLLPSVDAQGGLFESGRV